MTPQRRALYPPNWNELARACKEDAGWRCASCKIRHGSRRTSQRTGRRYVVYLHAAHVSLDDTRNPCPELRCLCPTCHGRYDVRLRIREGRISLERLKHRLLLKRRAHVVA